MPRITQLCAHCGASFSAPLRDDRQFCSQVCSKLSLKRRITKTCEYCSMDYSDTPARIKESRFCSPQCKQSSSRTGPSLHTLTCAHCGQSFTHTQKFTRFCSHACYYASGTTRVTKNCEVCGRVFNVQYSQQDQRFCSHVCKGKDRERRVSLICVQCNQPFEVLPERKDVAKYCSSTCYHIGTRVIVQKTCEGCGEVYEGTPSEIAQSRFCSRTCARTSAYETNPERIVRTALTAMGIVFQQEYAVVRRYSIDFFLPDMAHHGIALECDGVYWHTMPGQAERDHRRDIFLLSQGIPTVRVTDYELLHSDNPAQLIAEKLKQVTPLPHNLYMQQRLL